LFCDICIRPDNIAKQIIVDVTARRTSVHPYYFATVSGVLVIYAGMPVIDP
jgi:hypothetical protein